MATQLAHLSDSDLYRTDFYEWTKRQQAYLLARRWHDIDIDNLAEEIADLGGSVERAIESRLHILMGHLVKLALSADPYPRRGWWNTVRDQRREIAKILRKNPSLNARFDEIYRDEWQGGLDHGRGGLRNEEMDLVLDGPPWLTPELAMTIIDDSELRALAPRLRP